MSAELAEDATSATRATWSVAGLTRRISTPVWGMIVGGVLALIVIVSIISLRARDKANQPDVLALPVPASSEPSMSISSSAPPGTTPAPVVASAAAVTPSAHPTTRTHAMSKAAASASVKPKAKDPCVPPWYIDKNGDKRFRTECL